MIFWWGELVTYVPGFWSVNGLNSTVWTSISAAFRMGSSWELGYRIDQLGGWCKVGVLFKLREKTARRVE